MKLSILLHTDDFRGDHGCDVFLAYEAQPDETVEHLAERLVRRVSGPRYQDKIEIRFVNEHGN